MTDIVNPGGRPMTGPLQRAIDNLTGSTRRATIAAMRASEGTLAPLYHALALELELCTVRDAETDREFRAMMQNSIADPPFPRPSGPALRFDPESGVLIDIPDDSGQEGSP